MKTDSKSLINNTIKDNTTNEYKNNLIFKPTNKNNIDNDNINSIKDFKDNVINNDNENNSIYFDYNMLIRDEINTYEGYAIITRPTYNIIDDTGGKGEIII